MVADHWAADAEVLGDCRVAGEAGAAVQVLKLPGILRFWPVLARVCDNSSARVALSVSREDFRGPNGTFKVPSAASVPFGKTLREKRLEKTFTLRKFAELVGVSPTYLSQVEQCNVVPPTADRVKRIADLLEQNPDEWIALAGHVPEDVSEIIREEPTELCGLLRTVQGMTAEQIRKLRKAAERIKKDGDCVANRCLGSRLPPTPNTDTSTPFSLFPGATGKGVKDGEVVRRFYMTQLGG